MKKGRLTLALLTLMVSVVPLNVIADPDNTAVKSTADSADGTAENQETSGSATINSEKSTAETDLSKIENQNQETESANSEVKNDTNAQEQTESSANDDVTTRETGNTSEEKKIENTSKSTSESKEVTKKLSAEVEGDKEKEVRTTDEFKEALGDAKITLIKLKGDLDLKDGEFPVSHSVTIDGGGSTITYGTFGGNPMTERMGISFGEDNIAITVENLNFGKKKSLVPWGNANNPYGCVTQGSKDRKNCKLIMEGIDYYSEKGINVCTFNDSSNKVIIKGKGNIFNADNMHDNFHSPMIRAGQIEFEEGSVTKICSSQIGLYGLFEGDYGVRVDVGAGASVEIEANKFLFGTYNNNGRSGDCTLNLDDNAVFECKLDNSSISSEDYETIPQHDVINIETGENSTLSIDMVEGNITNPITATLGKDSTTYFGTMATSSGVFGEVAYDAPKIDFILNSIKNLYFASNPFDYRDFKFGPIGKNNKLTGSIKFSNIGYDIKYSKGYQGDKGSFYQKRNSIWEFNEGIFTEGVENYGNHQKALQDSDFISISKSDAPDESDGELKLVTVPDTLEWTGRTMSESKGILSRDKNNKMTIEVEDSRKKPTPWKVTAQVFKKDDNFNDFSLVWRDNSGEVKALDKPTTVLTNDSVEPINNVYSVSWGIEEGVLLKSDKYLSIGDYSNQLTIKWMLSDVATGDNLE